MSLFSGFSPLHLAVLQGHKDLARMLLNAGADINAMVGPCVTLSRHWWRIQFILSASTDIFFSNQDIKSGQSPLMHAVEGNNADMVHFLIEVMGVCAEKTVVSQLYVIILVFLAAHQPHTEIIILPCR